MECKNLNETRAQLLFKIRGSDGVIETRRIEVSLEELKQVKKELIRIEETLSWKRIYTIICFNKKWTMKYFEAV